MISISRTPAFRSFQRTVGNATFHINAAYIGLELIARGAEKPTDLKIKWTAPKSPDAMVAQSRSFIHAAMLGHLFTATDTYLRDIAGHDTLPIEHDRRLILRKAVTKPGGYAYSIGDRFAHLAGPSKGNVRADELLVNLMAKWRNLAAHEDHSETDVKSRVEPAVEAELVSYQLRFTCRYGSLNIATLLDHLKSNEAPSRKDIIALASATQNYVRWVDGEMIRRFITDEQAIINLAYAELKNALMTPDDRALRVTWGRDAEARERRLKSILEEAGFNTTACARPHLPETFLSDLALCTIADVVTRLS
jgi:hypothetical protein